MGERIWKYDMTMSSEPSKEQLNRMKLKKRQETIDTILNGGKPRVEPKVSVQPKVEVPVKVSFWEKLKSKFKR